MQSCYGQTIPFIGCLDTSSSVQGCDGMEETKRKRNNVYDY